MRKLASSAIRHPLVSGSSVIVVSSFAANIFNFVFNLFMVQNLKPGDYATLISLVSFTTLLTIPSGAISPMVIQFAGSFFAQNELDMVKVLFRKVFKITLVLAVVSSLVIIIIQTFISQFLNIPDSGLLIVVATSVFISFINVVNTSLLQAKLLFKFMSFTSVIAFAIKLLFGILFIKLGFAVFGAMTAIFLSLAVPYLLSFIPLSFLFNKSKKNMKDIKIKGLFIYGAPAAIALFGLNAFISTDVLLVKHFFSPQTAGIYAAGLSLVGRIIFYISAPIAMVMFPIAVQRHARGENYHTLLGLAVLLVIVPSLFITAFYFVFPEFSIQLIARQKPYLSVAPYLGLYGIFITLYSLLSLLVQFFLSIKKTFVAVPVGIAALLQAVFLWFIHENFLQIIFVSLFIISLLIFSLLIYYFKLYFNSNFLFAHEKKE